MEKTKTTIREFLSRFFKTADLKDDDDIFALGFVNSLFAMQLVMFIEKEFGFTIDNEELDISNFRASQATAQRVERKTSSATPTNS